MKKRIKTISGIIGIVVLLLLVNQFFYFPVKSSIFSFFSPVQEFFWSLNNNISTKMESIFNAGELKKENKQLRKRNLTLKQKVLEMKELEKENQKLRKALDLDLKKEFSLISGEIIANKTGKNSFLFNKGKAEGVKVGMPVITSDKVLIGKISKVFTGCSEVLMITSPGATFGIKIVSNGKENIASAKGGGGSDLEFKFLPKQAQVKKGDMVKTALSEKKFPKDLLVGEVESIKEKDVKSFQEGKISPYFAKRTLNIAFIIEDFVAPKEKEKEE